ncbi:MAG: glycosyltransferase family 39 protein [Desulfosporosinus sp.]|nr:glycosyltransferase family 39 protein [Desulfosporosinus sp.]
MGRGVRRFFLFLILLVALGVRLRGITNPLLDNQAWRQADTASMSSHMLGHLTDIPNVFLPQLNYDGITPQRVELEFPFFSYLLAWTWTLFGWADIWGRLWSVVLSLATVGGIYDLGRRMFTDRAGLLAAAIYALMPLSIYYGRVVMPEPMAQAWSIWALAMIWRWRTQEGRGSWKVGLLMAGAILAKLPQLMLFPVAIMLGFWPVDPKRVGQLIRYSMIVIIPPMVYYLWVHFQVSSSSQFVSGILTEQVSKTGNLDWKLLSRNIHSGFTDSILLLSGAGLCRLIFFRSPARWALLVWVSIAVLYIGVVCVRIPLDYYLVPVLPLTALLSAYALDGIPCQPGIVLGLVLLVLNNRGSYTYLTPKYQWNPEYLSQARWIKDHTSASSVLVLSDPPPMTFYYAHRVGFRLTQVGDEENPTQILQQFPGDYFVQLPQNGYKELFWKNVRKSYPEIGPGIFDLKSPRHN